MTSSLFDLFSSNNVPSNPTVPPTAPPGFTAPSGVANPSSKSPPMTSAQIAAIQKGMQENNLQQVVQATTGAYIPGNGSAFDQLEVWANSLDNGAQNIENLVSSLLGIPSSAWDGLNEMLDQVESWARQIDGGIQQILTWWNSLINGLLGSSSGGTGTVYDLTTWLQNAEANANAAWTELQDFFATGNWSDLSAAWQDLLQAIFGSATTPPLTSWIPASWVVNESTNSQPVPDFPNVASLATVSYNGGGWAPGPGFSGSAGSAVCTANGSPWLLTGVPLPVQPGQVAQRAALVQWSGLSAASGTSPIQLQLIPWSSTGGLDPQPGTPGAAVTITEITSPAASGGPTEISGQYTVPSSGVGYVQAAILVTADATAGTVSWTNCTTAIEGGFLPQLQAGFEQLQADSTASQQATQTFLQAIKTATTNDAGNFGQWWTDVSAAYQTWAATESGLASNEFSTLQQMFNAAMGLNTATGQVSGSNVSSSTGLASLEADWNQWVANIQAGWNSLFGVTAVPTNSSQVKSTSVASSLSGANLSADITTTHTTASNASSWSTRLTNDLLILSDVFHLTYQAGSSGDAPGTLGTNGKPTWYSAWNDLLALCGIVNSTTAPTDTAPTTGTVIQANTAAANTASTNANTALANNQSVVDQFNYAMTGSPTTGQPITSVYGNATNIPASNVNGVSVANVTYGNAASNFGLASSISFSITPSSTDTFVLALVPWLSGSSSNGPSTATFGGTAMTLVDRAVSAPNAGGYLIFEVFLLKITAGAGAKTFSWSNSGATGVDAGVMTFYAQKILNYIQTGGGISSSAPLTMSYTSTAASPTANRVVGAFAVIGSSKATWSGFTPGTVHIDNGPTGAQGGVGLYAGDVAGSASTQNFSASHGLTAGPAGQWVGFALEVSN